MRLPLSSRPRPRPLASCIRLVPDHLSGQERVRHTDGRGWRGMEGTCREAPPIGRGTQTRTQKGAGRGAPPQAPAKRATGAGGG